MARISVQQQLERHPGGRDGSGQDHPDNRTGHIPHGEEESQWAIPYYCSSQVSLSKV